MSKILFRLLPWVLILVIITFLIIYNDPIQLIKGNTHDHTATILTEVETLGKLELIKYNFQEVTEFKKDGGNLDLKIIKIPIYNEAKGLLVSYGTAVTCIGLSNVTEKDIWVKKDTLYVQLPKPELCYFKIDLEKTRIYDMDTKYLADDERKEFMEEMYRIAENKIKESALSSNILDQASISASMILKPLFESLTGKPVMIQNLQNKSLERVVLP